LTDAFSFLKMARRYGFSGTAYVVVNMVSDLHAARTAFKRFKQATEQYLQLQVGYLGYVLQDHHVQASIRKQQPVMLSKPECLASRCIRVIAERLIRLLENQSRDSEAFSDYLREMNQPFGIGLQQAGQCAVEQDAEWQKQALLHLQAMDKDVARGFLRCAVSEWAVRHNADEAELFSGQDQTGQQEPVSRQATAIPSVATVDSIRPSLHVFQDSVAKSPYAAAVQFAELLARIEKR